MLRLQVPERRNDLRWGANGAQGVLPTALRQLGVNEGIAGVVFVAPRPRQQGEESVSREYALSSATMPRVCYDRPLYDT